MLYMIVEHFRLLGVAERHGRLVGDLDGGGLRCRGARIVLQLGRQARLPRPYTGPALT
jgi:hypothetical protein